MLQWVILHIVVCYAWIPEEGLLGQGVHGFLIWIVTALQGLCRCGPCQQCMGACFLAPWSTQHEDRLLVSCQAERCRFLLPCALS